MNPMSIGNGIAVAGSLLAVAGVLIALIISNQKNKQAKLDFLRGAVERGASLSPELIDTIMRPSEIAASRRALPRGQGTLVAAIIVIALGVGYTIFAYFISRIAPSALLPMMGAASLIFSIGIGLFVVSKVLRGGRSATDSKG